jgi:hypothetical protein
VAASVVLLGLVGCRWINSPIVISVLSGKSCMKSLQCVSERVFLQIAQI